MLANKRFKSLFICCCCCCLTFVNDFYSSAEPKKEKNKTNQLIIGSLYSVEKNRENTFGLRCEKSASGNFY